MGLVNQREHTIKQNRAWLWFFKRALSCNRCGYDVPPPALDFHHEDSGDKEFSISHGTQRGICREKIYEEIKKCEPLCAICHRLEKNQQPLLPKEI